MGVIDFLLVAGGGAGGFHNNLPAGGGGAGGYIFQTGLTINNGQFNVTVGAGGVSTGVETNGQDSVFSGFTAIGGGHGDGYLLSGSTGGCGGGAGTSLTEILSGGIGLQGFNGEGTHYVLYDGNPYHRAAGGGGGMGGPGNGNDGGPGYTFPIFGSIIGKIGGGGAAYGSYAEERGTATDGGGQVVSPFSGATPNTGGGGCGNQLDMPAVIKCNGASGVFLFRIRKSEFPYYSLRNGTTVFEDATYTIHKFNQGGTFNISDEPIVLPTPTPTPTRSTTPTPTPTATSIPGATPTPSVTPSVTPSNWKVLSTCGFNSEKISKLYLGNMVTSGTTIEYPINYRALNKDVVIDTWDKVNKTITIGGQIVQLVEVLNTGENILFTENLSKGSNGYNYGKKIQVSLSAIDLGLIVDSKSFLLNNNKFKQAPTIAFMIDADENQICIGYDNPLYLVTMETNIGDDNLLNLVWESVSMNRIRNFGTTPTPSPPAPTPTPSGTSPRNTNITWEFNGTDNSEYHHTKLTSVDLFYNGGYNLSNLVVWETTDGPYISSNTFTQIDNTIYGLTGFTLNWSYYANNCYGTLVYGTLETFINGVSQGIMTQSVYQDLYSGIYGAPFDVVTRPIRYGDSLKFVLNHYIV